MSGLYGPPIAPATLYGVRNPKTVFLGDSVTLGASGVGTSNIGEAFCTYAALVGNQQMRVGYVAGVAGQRSDQILARVATDVLPQNPGYCLVMAGTNDVSQNIAASVAMTNIASIIAQLRGAGIVPILCTIPPRDTAATSGTIAQARAATALLNHRIRYYAAANNVPLLGVYAALVDPATGGYLSGKTTDGLHPNPVGQLLAAQAIQSALAAIFPPGGPPLVMSAGDTTNIILNGTMVDGNADNVADSWTTQLTGGGTATYTVTTDSNIVGSVQSIQKTDANANGFCNLYQYIAMSGKASIGDRLAIAGKYTLAGGAYATLKLLILDAGYINPTTIQVWNAATQPLATAGTFYTEFTIPATVGGSGNPPAQLQVMCSAYQAAGTLKVGQMTLLNLTQLGF